jgi:hypothetical protein
MKVKIFYLFLFAAFPVILSAQDTIFVRNGQVIPAVIIEKNNAEIKYKKFGQPDPAPIYSLFVIDISSIHFSDGMIADYTRTGEPGIIKPERPLDLAGTMRVAKWSLGFEYYKFERDISDNLLLFWRDRLGDKNATIGGNPVSIPVLVKMSFVLGNSGRNWIGDELQLIFTPADAIHTTLNNVSNEIKLKNFYYNIILYYGHTLNHKRNLIGIIEPGADFGFMSGYIKLNNTKYDISGNLGVGFHIALGGDWIISKRFMASGRAGYRFMTVKESHKNKASSTGYSTFYVDPGVNTDLLTVKWNGPYLSLGLSWSFYTKMKFGGNTK